MEIKDETEAFQAIKALLDYFQQNIQPEQPLATALAERMLYGIHSLIYDAKVNPRLQMIKDVASK